MRDASGRNMVLEPIGETEQAGPLSLRFDAVRSSWRQLQESRDHARLVAAEALNPANMERKSAVPVVSWADRKEPYLL